MNSNTVNHLFISPQQASHLQIQSEPAIFDEPKFNLTEFRGQANREREKMLRRYHRAALYIDALFNNMTSRLLVLRIDFAYKEEWSQSITGTQAIADFNHLLNNRRGNLTLFNGWVGYIRKLEYSSQKGFHFHVMLFFNGQLRQNDKFLAKEIGEYWKQITANRGVYWNCNDNEADYRRYGVGMIEYNNAEKRKVLLEDVAKYLTKVEQKPLDSYSASGRDKLFVMGIMPRERASSVGRPRSGC